MNIQKKFMVIILIIAIISTGCTDIRNNDTSIEKNVYKKIYVGVYSSVHSTILKQIDELIKEDGYTIIIKFYDNREDLLYATAANDIDAAYGITDSEIDDFCYNTGFKINSINTNTFEPMLCFINHNLYRKLEKPEIMIPQEKFYFSRISDFLTTPEVIHFITTNNKNVNSEYSYDTNIFVPYDAQDLIDFLNYRGCVIMTAVNAIETGITNLEKYDYIIEDHQNDSQNIMIAVSANNKIDDKIKRLENEFQSEEFIKFIHEYYLGLIIVLQ